MKLARTLFFCLVYITAPFGGALLTGCGGPSKDNPFIDPPAPPAPSPEELGPGEHFPERPRPDAGPYFVDPPDAGPVDAGSVSRLDAAPPDAGPVVNIPDLVPGSSNVFCACLYVVTQEVTCTAPEVNCRTGAPLDRPDPNTTFQEQAFWNDRARTAQAAYFPVVGSEVTTELQDVCPLSLTLGFVNTYAYDEPTLYSLPSGGYCTVARAEVRCEGNEYHERGCV